jgi:alkylation response protein AidB-like acyl-CoA dehydrogenase
VTFAFTPEHDEFRRSLRGFLAEKSPSGEVRRLMNTDQGHDRLLWSQMADQLGLQGLVIGEELGGSGGTPVELSIVFEEMGRVLLCAPYLSTVGLAAQALQAAADDAARAAYLPRIADGSLLATLAVAEEDGRWGLDAITATATPAGDGWRLDGTKMFVVDGHCADLLLVVARAGDGLGLLAVDGDAAGVTRTPLSTLDRTRKLARLEFSQAEAHLVSGPGDATAALGHALDLALVAVTAEQAGGAERCLEMAVGYANIREQFGRPIGSFQAIKHKCADMLVGVEASKSAAYYAAWSAAQAPAELAEAAATAKAYCSDAYFKVAADNLQVHGGIGFTWEHDAHLYLRRAKSSQLLFGDARQYRSRLADLTGI